MSVGDVVNSGERILDLRDEYVAQAHPDVTPDNWVPDVPEADFGPMGIYAWNVVLTPGDAERVMHDTYEGDAKRA